MRKVRVILKNGRDFVITAQKIWTMPEGPERVSVKCHEPHSGEPLWIAPGEVAAVVEIDPATE
jgi:hypothetical protein